MSDTKSHFFNEINDHSQEELLQQSLAEQQATRIKLEKIPVFTSQKEDCDVCGYPIDDAGYLVYDENSNSKPGLIQCKHCKANSYSSKPKKKLPF